MQEWAGCLDRWERGEPQPLMMELFLPDSLQLIAEYLKTLVEGGALDRTEERRSGRRHAASTGTPSFASETASRNAWRKLEGILLITALPPWRSQ